MNINDYTKIIENKFSYLFTTFHFQIVYTDQKGQSRYRVGLRSDLFKIKVLFVREGGGGIIFLGPLNATFYDESDKEWVGLVPLLLYIRKREINWKAIDNIKKDDDQIIPVMNLVSDEFKPVCNEIIGMFSTPSLIEQWKPEYKNYIREYPG